jgi:hypothetical protein
MTCIEVWSWRLEDEMREQVLTLKEAWSRQPLSLSEPWSRQLDVEARALVLR